MARAEFVYKFRRTSFAWPW